MHEVLIQKYGLWEVVIIHFILLFSEEKWLYPDHIKIFTTYNTRCKINIRIEIEILPTANSKFSHLNIFPSKYFDLTSFVAM